MSSQTEQIVLIEPSDVLKFKVILQPFYYDANEKNEHRFLVQTVVINPVTDYGEDGKHFQWQDIEEGRIMDSKLKCSFEMPVEQLLESENIHGETTAVLETEAKTELQIVTAEIEKLCEEENFLKQENAVLKEELMKLQFITDDYQSQKSSVSDSQHLDMQNRNLNITATISLAIIVAMFGIIAGKYVF